RGPSARKPLHPGVSARRPARSRRRPAWPGPPPGRWNQPSRSRSFRRRPSGAPRRASPAPSHFVPRSPAAASSAVCWPWLFPPWGKRQSNTRATAAGSDGTNGFTHLSAERRRLMRGEPRIPAAWPRVLAGRSDASARRTALEVLADPQLERANVALGQVLEAPPARGKGGFGGVEPRNGSHGVLVVLGEHELHGAAQRRGAGQRRCATASIAAALHDRAQPRA